MVDNPSLARIGLPPAQFAAAFPFHLAVGADLAIVQAGSTLLRLCPDVRPGAKLDQVFRAIRPGGRITFDWLQTHKGQFFLLEHLGSSLQLRGEFVEVAGEGKLVFLGSPWFTDTADMAARGLGFEDFAIHDPVVDMLQLFQASKMALADAKKLAARLTAQRAELRAANERLRQQEREARRLAHVAARTDNAVVLTDAAGIVLWVNEGFTRLTGYAPGEVLGRKPGSLLQGPGTDPATVCRIAERLGRGEGFSEEILNYGKDGREYWVAIEVQPIRDEQGRIANFMAIESDITARRAAQQRLGIQYEVSLALSEANDQSTAMTRILRVICEKLGWELGQLWQVAGTRLQFAGAWHPDSASAARFVDANRAMEFARGSGMPGRVWSTVEPRWIPDLSRDAGFRRAPAAMHVGLRGAFAFPVLVRGVPFAVLEFFSRRIEEPDAGLLQTFAAVGIQIGQFIVRRNAEDALRESEERFRLALEGADLGTWDLHVPSGAGTVNDRYAQMLGYAPGEFGSRFDERLQHIHPDDLSRAVETFAAHLRGETGSYACEYRIRHKSGGWVWVLDRGRVIDRSPDGSPTRVCGTHLDITLRKRAEDELQEEKLLLEQARLRELEMGHAIQRALLIGDPPAPMRGIELASYTEPSQGIDGDFYAFTTFRPDCLELLVGDVMGKGVPAALIGAAVRTSYNQVVTELLAASLGSGHLPQPAAVVNALHAKLTPRLIELDAFVTMALYRFDLAAGTMRFVNAGHTAGLLIRAGGGLDEVLGENLPVGVLPEERYVEKSEALRAGDALLVYSDGLTEARDGEGNQFGEERLRGFIGQTRRLDLPPNIWLQALRRTVRRFVGSDEMLDDQSAVLVGIRSLAAREGEAPGTLAAPELFDLPWDAAQLAPLRSRVAAAAAFLGADAADGLVLAAFEAATNVVRHVAPPFHDAALSCRIIGGSAWTSVEIWYLGEPFQPAAELQPDFSGDSDGGFGLYIMSQAVSSVSHETPLPGVCCTRLIQLAPAPIAD